MSKVTKTEKMKMAISSAMAILGAKGILTEEQVSFLTEQFVSMAVMIYVEYGEKDKLLNKKEASALLAKEAAVWCKAAEDEAETKPEEDEIEELIKKTGAKKVTKDELIDILKKL